MAASIFARIVCGVDGTPASTAAVTRAAVLAEEGGTLLLVAVADEALLAGLAAGAGGMVVPPVALETGQAWLEPAAEQARSAARNLRIDTRALEGPVLPTLLAAVKNEGATLVALGRHGHSRLAGLVLGSVTTAALHDADCSVLVCGSEPLPERFPRTIVVGFDGSDQAAGAVGAAAELARRTGATLEAVCATGGKDVEVDRLQARLTDLSPGVRLSVVDAEPAGALTAQECDLIVVGSRGLHGLKSLGSVSERVAHHADGSVLVVR